MSPLTQRIVMLYLFLLLLLAFVGIRSQALHKEHRALVFQHEELVQQRTLLVDAAAEKIHAERVANWAESNGMIATPPLSNEIIERSNLTPAAPLAPQTTVEIKTQWR